MKDILLEEQQDKKVEIEKEGGQRSGSFNIVAPIDTEQLVQLDVAPIDTETEQEVVEASHAFQSRDGSALEKPEQ